MAKYFKFNKTTGAGLGWVECQEEYREYQYDTTTADSIEIYGNENDGTHYVVLGSPNVLTAKEEFPITQDTDTLDGSPLGYSTFTNIPEDTTVVFDDEDVTEYIDGSPRSIELTADEDGVYNVVFTNIKYLTETFTITVSQ